jgi:spermidine/putrescine transport system ATP-binding protein
VTETEIRQEGRDHAGGAEAVVELVRVTKHYGSMAAVDDVSMAIGREFFSLLGPSGSGKTSLLRIIAGFAGISSGRVVIAGNDVTRVPPHKRPCNTVFQQYALFPHLTVAGNIAFGLKEQKVPKREITTRVGEALELVRLSGSEKKHPHQLSGGQQQRVALARVLVTRPTVLLLDEPLAALDAKLRKGMQVELKRLQQEVGISFVYVTHDQEEALAMSDRLAVMHDGKVQQVGAPQDVYDDPASAFVADFVGHSNLIDGEVTGTDGDALVLQLGAGQRLRVPGLHTGRGRGRLMVRPEDIVLTRKGSGDGEHRLTGQVVGQMFLGAATRVEVALGDDTRVVSVRDRHTDEVRVGDWVGLDWRPGAARFFPEAP